MDKQQEREYREVESIRESHFEKRCRQLAEDGYEPQSATVKISRANIYTLLIMLPFAALIFIPYYRRYGFESVNSNLAPFISLILFIVALAGETVLHEGIHGLVWGLAGGEGFSDIEFGFIHDTGTPYCYCGVPLPRWKYILGKALPTLILGIGQGIAAIAFANPVILLLSMVQIFAGGGDFLVIWKLLLRRKQKKEMIVLEFPKRLGCMIFEK